MTPVRYWWSASDQWQSAEFTEPPSLPGQERIDVLAVAFTRHEAVRLQQAAYDPDPETGWGKAFCGRVHSTGKRVMGVLPEGGALVSHLRLDPQSLLPVPETMSAEAAAATMANLQQLQQVRFRVSAQGEWLLHAGYGGLWQLVRHYARIQGLQVTTIYPTMQLQAIHGAAENSDYEDSGYEHRLGQNRFSVIIDAWGGRCLRPNMLLIAPGGLLFMPGLDPAQEQALDLGPMLGKTWQSVALNYQDVTADQKVKLLKLLEFLQSFQPLIDGVHDVHTLSGTWDTVRLSEGIGVQVIRF